MKYDQLTDGVWVRPSKKYKLLCCDCGLSHDMEFRIRKGQIEFRATRNNRSTAAARRRMSLKIRITK